MVIIELLMLLWHLLSLSIISRTGIASVGIEFITSFKTSAIQPLTDQDKGGVEPGKLRMFPDELLAIEKAFGIFV